MRIKGILLIILEGLVKGFQEMDREKGTDVGCAKPYEH